MSAEHCTNCGGEFWDGRHKTTYVPNNPLNEELCPKCAYVLREKTGLFDGQPIDDGWGGYTPEPMGSDALFDAAHAIAERDARISELEARLAELTG